MTANPEPTPQLQRQLYEMVRSKTDFSGCVSDFDFESRWQDAIASVALDLLSKLDAAEAQVESLKLETKALTEERDHLIKLSHRLRSDLMAYGKHLFTCSAIKERLGECNCGLRAALKLGGEK